jgi:excisionase family DNA binding protein
MTQTIATPGPTYLNTEEIARRYNVNEDTARRWIRTGRIPGHRIGGAYRVRLDDLQTLEREGTDFTVETTIEKPGVDSLLQRLEDWAVDLESEEDVLYVHGIVAELRRVLGTVSEERILLQRIEQLLHERPTPAV